MVMESWKGTENQYIQLVKVLYHKLLTKGKQLPAFPFEVSRDSKRWEVNSIQIGQMTENIFEQ